MTALSMLKARKGAETGVQRYKHSIVVDLSGMGMSLVTGKTRHFLQKLFAVGGDYFPESIWKIYVVNAPFMFRVRRGGPRCRARQYAMVVVYPVDAGGTGRDRLCGPSSSRGSTRSPAPRSTSRAPRRTA